MLRISAEQDLHRGPLSIWPSGRGQAGAGAVPVLTMLQTRCRLAHRYESASKQALTAWAVPMNM